MSIDLPLLGNHHLPQQHQLPQSFCWHWLWCNPLQTFTLLDLHLLITSVWTRHPGMCISTPLSSPYKSIQVNIHREVSQQLQHYPNLQGDGTAFWICLTCVIFPNMEIFTASIKSHIWQLNLSSCKHDLNDYIAQVEDLLQLLGLISTNELLPDLFCQLKLLLHFYFNKAITDLEQQYYLGKEHGLTCFQLCTEAIKIKRIQEQVQQWDTPNPDDQNLQALHATLLAHQQVIESLMANTSNNSCH